MKCRPTWQAGGWAEFASYFNLASIAGRFQPPAGRHFQVASVQLGHRLASSSAAGSSNWQNCLARAAPLGGGRKKLPPNCARRWSLIKAAGRLLVTNRRALLFPENSLHFAVLRVGSTTPSNSSRQRERRPICQPPGLSALFCRADNWPCFSPSCARFFARLSSRTRLCK